MHLDLEKDLPFREGRKAYLTRTVGTLYDLRLYRRPSDSSKDPYHIKKRVLKKYLGKSVDDAFSHYCKLVKKEDQHIFLDEFRPRRWYSYSYIVDSNKNIQYYSLYKPSKPFIKSPDYEVEIVHKTTGHKRSSFNQLSDFLPFVGTYIANKQKLNPELNKSDLIKEYESLLKNRYYYHDLRFIVQTGQFVQTGPFPYRASGDDFVSVVTKGWIKYFSSKNDPAFKKHFARKLQKKTKKPSLSEEEFRSILNARKNQDKEETALKLERKGFRPNAFTNHI